MSGLPVLTRHEPARNMARLTRLEIAPGRFGGAVLIRQTCRIGCRVQERRQWWQEQGPF